MLMNEDNLWHLLPAFIFHLYLPLITGAYQPPIGDNCNCKCQNYNKKQRIFHKFNHSWVVSFVAHHSTHFLWATKSFAL